jgi:hypothetical protein
MHRPWLILPNVVRHNQNLIFGNVRLEEDEDPWLWSTAARPLNFALASATLESLGGASAGGS